MSVVTLMASTMLIGVGEGRAVADVTAVKAGAFGYSCTVTSCTPSVPTPSVTLAPDGSNSPQSSTATSGRADANSTTLFTSGQIVVGVQGSLGQTGSTSSSSSIANVSTLPQGGFTASNLTSSCNASESSTSGSTTISDGTLLSDNGDGTHGAASVSVATNPAPNTTYQGHVHTNTSTETFTWVFNEQILNSDGSITVNAARQSLTGPTATGELILGHVVCGVTPPFTPPPPGSADLSISITDFPDPVATGEQVTYDVDVTNIGTEAATGVTLLTRIKGGKLVSTDGATCAPFKSQLGCDLADVAPGDTERITLVVSAGHRSVTTTSTVWSTGDSDSSNNTATATTSITR
ncbi:MAG TPA: hypothetical protein VMZ51_09440 [Acidimicrobiales bacterium]|nr:hypothetical protein [Acidimicrobiales bacterium]